jgi:hypothetical protein
MVTFLICLVAVAVLERILETLNWYLDGRSF